MVPTAGAPERPSRSWTAERALRLAPARSALPGVTLLLLVAAVAAGWTIWQAQGMWTATGTAGLGAAGFSAMWAAMMAAMMLPSMAPVAALYLRSLDEARTRRGAAFVGGYLLVWVSTALVAYGLALATNAVLTGSDAAPRVFAAGLLLLNAFHHLTPAHRRWLGRCRSPFGLILNYAGHRGRLRDVRAGIHHGLTCLGCCWTLMALMLVFGVMNVAAMVVIAGVVAAEKLWRAETSHAVSAVSAALALGVLAVPELAIGLAPR